MDVILCGTLLQEARLAQSVEHQTFNLRVEGSSPSLGGNTFCNGIILEEFEWSFYVLSG